MYSFYEPTTDSLFYGYSKCTINKTALTNLIIFIEKILRNNPIGKPLPKQEWNFYFD